MMMLNKKKKLSSVALLLLVSSSLLLLFPSCLAADDDDDDKEKPWITACANATFDLQSFLLVNETEAWHAAIAMTYNATNYDDYCKTEHYTSSCVLDFDTMEEEEEAYRIACLAAGGKLFAIDEVGRYYCTETGDSDFVRLLNLKGHDECVATICQEEELEENYEELTQNDADFFSQLVLAECNWEEEFTDYSAAVPGITSASALVIVATAAFSVAYSIIM